jgi:penicillin-binding protein 1A
MQMKKTGYFWKRGFWALISLSFLLTVAAGLFYIYLASQLPSVDSLKSVQLQVPLRIYTQDGLLIQEYGEKRRIPLTYDQIPPMLVHALIATEDQRFFDHSGVDIYGLARATVRMIQTGTKSQGGSTITMQVARNFFLNRKKTFLRKFHEIMLAIKIDRELSKEKILELYLNKIYLGNRAYGMGAAAQIYYGKALNELSIAQLAMLAGLPQAPSTQNPIANPTAAKKRRDHVLERLLEEKYISQAEYEHALAEPVTTKNFANHIEVSAPYVAEMIRQSLFDHFGSKAYTKGYKVYTTINGHLQTTANETLEANLLAYDRRHGYRGSLAHMAEDQVNSANARQHALSAYPNVNDLEPAVVVEVGSQDLTAITRKENSLHIPWQGLSWARPALRNGWMGKAPTQATQIARVGDIIYLRQTPRGVELSQIPQVEGALIALNPQNGAIFSLVGGFNFEKSKFNRAIQSSRQPGSSFKPFIYAAALNKGYSLATLINDAPIVVDDPSQANLWRPHNDKLKFNGPTRFKEALVHSLNLVSIRILDDIGIDYAADFVNQFGFNKTTLPRTLSLALGSLSVSPMELSAAYAVFANGGFKIEPYLIDRITDGDGKILIQAKPSIVCPQCTAKNKTDALAPRVIPEDVAFLMHTAMQEVVKRGTAHDASRLHRNDIAGKTGSTNDLVDVWFAGYTPDLVAVTWVGFDTPRPLHEYAAGLALPLWIDFMQVALKGKAEHALTAPDNILMVPIDPSTGLQVPANQNNAIIEFFRKDEVPAQNDNSSMNAAAPGAMETQEHLF